ncbi:MAG: DUF4145 domain-containing protein [Bacteroidia bacterium]
MLLECDKCKALVNAEVIASYVAKLEKDDWCQDTKYTLCKCPQCNEAILASQEYDLIDDEMDWDTPIKIFPNNTFHINSAIPEQLKKALIECIQCFKANSYTATAIMCRRTIEGFVTIKGIKERDLAQSIKKMKEDGIINEQLFEWANQLRLVGNKAAHDIDSEFSSVDAKDILDFTIAILDFTFSFKDKFDKFKERHIKIAAKESEKK